eukprot:scaffold23575_cov65-Phaeocystis_antarctica.AAC.3
MLTVVTRQEILYALVSTSERAAAVRAVLRVVLGHPRLLPFDDSTGAVVLMRPKGVDVARHEVVADASHQRVPVGHRRKAGVPHVSARLDFLVDVNCVPHVVVAEVRHAREDIVLVRNTLHAQVLRVVHELRECRVTYLGAAEVDDLHVAFGVLEREPDSEEHAEGAAKRVACHEELGFGSLGEHLFHLSGDRTQQSVCL